MPITFVNEYCSYTTDFRIDPHPVAAIDVSPCHLLEINNRDETGNRTVFSLSHFTVGQLKYPNTGILQSNLEKIVTSFQDSGGDIDSAQVRIYGGRSFKSQLRDNLKQSLRDVFGEGVKISEPVGHHMHGARDTFTYMFSHDGVSYRKSDMNNEDGYADEFSRDMQNKDGSPNKGKVDEWQKAIDLAYDSVSTILDSRVQNRSRRILGYSCAEIEDSHSLSAQDRDNILSLLSIDLVSKTGVPSSVVLDPNAQSTSLVTAHVSEL